MIDRLIEKISWGISANMLQTAYTENSKAFEVINAARKATGFDKGYYQDFVEYIQKYALEFEMTKAERRRLITENIDLMQKIEFLTNKLKDITEAKMDIKG